MTDNFACPRRPTGGCGLCRLLPLPLGPLRCPRGRCRRRGDPPSRASRGGAPPRGGLSRVPRLRRGPLARSCAWRALAPFPPAYGVRWWRAVSPPTPPRGGNARGGRAVRGPPPHPPPRRPPAALSPCPPPRPPTACAAPPYAARDAPLPGGLCLHY